MPPEIWPASQFGPWVLVWLSWSSLFEIKMVFVLESIIFCVKITMCQVYRTIFSTLSYILINSNKTNNVMEVYYFSLPWPPFPFSLSSLVKGDRGFHGLWDGSWSTRMKQKKCVIVAFRWVLLMKAPILYGCFIESLKGAKVVMSHDPLKMPLACHHLWPKKRRRQN